MAQVTCSVCHESFERGFAHCASRTCTWCMKCYLRKVEECGLKKPPGLPGVR